MTGRSFCPQCGAALTAGDLVPVFSWLFLRGRCRHCRAPIPVRYLLVELLGGVLALGCRWRFGTAYTLGEGLFGMRWQGLLALALCGVLLSIALIDAETQLIPNRLNAAVAVLAVLNLLLFPARWAGALIGMVCISVPMLLLGIALWGVGMGAQESILKAAVTSMVPKASRATGYGIFECLFGIFWFLGSWLLGVLYDVSIPAMIAVSVAAQLAAIPLYIASSRRQLTANP